MKAISAMLLLTAMILFCSPSSLKAADVAAGKEAFAKKCSSCHGTAGEGKESLAALLKVELKNLGSKEVQSKSDAEIKKIALEGTGKMKAVKDLDAKTADNIVAYLRTLAQK